MTTYLPPVCLGCRHYHRDSSPPTCDAFPAPGSIPRAIFPEGDPHTEPVPGDHGIRFEPGEPRPAPLVAVAARLGLRQPQD